MSLPAACRVLVVVVATLATSTWVGADELAKTSALDREGRERLLPLFREGERLTPAQAADLESRLASKPGDVEARLRLLGHRSVDPKAEPAFVALVRGLIDQHARDPVGDAAGWLLELGMASPKAWADARAAWERLLAAHPDDASIAGNAGVFLARGSRSEEETKAALDLLLRAHRAQPKELRWMTGLVENRAHLGPRDRYELWRDLYATIPPDARVLAYEGGSLVAEHAAAAAWEAKEVDAAGRIAEDLLAKGTKENLGWNHGNVVHAMNVLLGRVSLAQGDVASAKARLLAAGRAPSSPQLASFGPDWTLAADLLEKGERGVVLEYVDLVGRFWEGEGERLATWRKAIEEGKRPDFPRAREDAAARPSPPAAQAQPEPATDGSAKPIVGYWESSARSLGGIGNVLEFRPDGTFRWTMVISADGLYAVDGDRLTLRPPAGVEGEPDTIPLGRFEKDAWVVKTEDMTIRRTRMTPAVAGGSPVVGTWTWRPDDEAEGMATYYERFTADGRFASRMPLPSARTGRYRVEGNALRMDFGDGKEQEVSFRIRGELLRTTEPSGTTGDYRWAGEKAWYPL